MPATYIKTSGAWKKCKDIYVKNNGIWRKCKEVYSKVSGTWRVVFKAPEYTRDIFGDGSCLGLWRFDGSLAGEDGTPDASMDHGDEAYVAGRSGQAFDLHNERVIRLGGIEYRDVKAWSFWVFKDNNNYIINIGSDNEYSLAHINVYCYSDQIDVLIWARKTDYFEARLVVGGSKDNPSNGWHHIVAQWHYDQNTEHMFGSIYIDGSNVGSDYDHVEYPRYGDAIVGDWYDKYPPYHYYSNGYIDHLRAFNRELSAAEIQTLYHELD